MYVYISKFYKIHIYWLKINYQYRKRDNKFPRLFLYIAIITFFYLKVIHDGMCNS